MSVSSQTTIGARAFSAVVARDFARRRSTALSAAFIAAVSIVLGLIRLSSPSIWIDEAFTARAVQLPFPDYLLHQYHSLYYLLLQPWVTVVGTSEWALRLPSVVAAAVASVLVFELGRQVFDRWVGLGAGLLLAASPFFVKWSQQGRSYTLLVAISLAATLCVLRALRLGTRRSWLLYGLTFSAAIVVQPVSALVLVPSHSVLAYQRRLQVSRHAFIAAMVAGAICLPWMFIVSRYSSEFWLVRPSVASAARALFEISGAMWLGVPLAVAGLVVLYARRRPGVATWLLTWAFVPFALAWVVSYVKPVYLDRYLIATAPAFALLGGVAIAYAASRLRPVLVAAAVTATVIGLVSWYSYDRGTNWRGEGWKQAVEETRTRLGPGDRVVIVPWWAYPAPAYYDAPVADTSTADSIWVLSWSETGHELTRETRRQLGFGAHELVDRRPYGWRVQAQHWQR